MNLEDRQKKLPQFPSANSSQRVTGERASGGIRNNLSVPAPATLNRSKKVALKPGHSPLDWANLNRCTPQHILRGVSSQTIPPQYLRIQKDELKKHKFIDDCWTCIHGKVYNITRYMDFHPGGVDEIMKCAGKDGTSLFNKYHSWVSADRILENCFIGLIDKS